MDASDNQDTRHDMRSPDTRYWTGAHTKHCLRYHMVWIPKYRRRILTGVIAQRLHELLHQAAMVNRWRIHELSIQPDHVHLLLQIHPDDCLKDVMQRLKGGTSRLIRSEFPDLEEFMWGKSFWALGYFAETVGTTQERVIRQYIRNQDVNHHGTKSQMPDVELSLFDE